MEGADLSQEQGGGGSGLGTVGLTAGPHSPALEPLLRPVPASPPPGYPLV